MKRAPANKCAWRDRFPQPSHNDSEALERRRLVSRHNSLTQLAQSQSTSAPELHAPQRCAARCPTHCLTRVQRFTALHFVSACQCWIGLASPMDRRRIRSDSGRENRFRFQKIANNRCRCLFRFSLSSTRIQFDSIHTSHSGAPLVAPFIASRLLRLVALHRFVSVSF